MPYHPDAASGKGGSLPQVSVKPAVAGEHISNGRQTHLAMDCRFDRAKFLKMAAAKQPDGVLPVLMKQFVETQAFEMYTETLPAAERSSPYQQARDEAALQIGPGEHVLEV